MNKKKPIIDEADFAHKAEIEKMCISHRIAKPENCPRCLSPDCKNFECRKKDYDKWHGRGK